jgi:uncharacterized membrane protein YfcA
LFPISTLIATVAISSGIGGAVFFSPLFIIGLQIEPYTAIGAGLITELFGFSSGLVGYVRAKLIDYKFGANLLFFSIPTSIIGVFLSGFFPNEVLMSIFAVGIIFVGWQIYISYQKERKETRETETSGQDFESFLVDKRGNTYKYTICNKPLARFFALIGGIFFGMISVGLAELQEYQLLVKCRIPTPIAVATSIFLVAVTVLGVAIVRIIIEVGGANYNELILISKIILFTAPGVLIGGQIGPYFQQRVHPNVMKLSIAVLLPLVGIFLLLDLFFWSIKKIR